MIDTPNLNLPYLLAAQSQKHVTHNEALRALDSLVQLSVLDRDFAAPPSAPVEGDRYIVAAGASGAWAGKTAKIAAYQDAAWLFYTPKEGWVAWVADENALVVFDGVGWALAASGGGGGGASDHGLLVGLSDDDHPQYHTDARGDARYTRLAPATLGVNATADTTNRLTVGSAASLFNHTGTGGHQIKVNKAAAGDTASFLFQTGFSGRAEIGTTGDDDFHFKVSANGSVWKQAIVVDRSTGAVSLPNTPRTMTQKIYTASATWTKPAGLTKIQVWGIGAGGSTPDSTAATGEANPCSGGGSGTYGFKEILASSLGATESVTVGVAVAASAGEASSFGAHMTLPGGAAGNLMGSGTVQTSVSTGLAGAASGADWSVTGSRGARGFRWSGTMAQGGNGTPSAFGSGGSGNINSSAIDANAYGAGGGGPCSVNTTTRAGALGGNGVMFVLEIY